MRVVIDQVQGLPRTNAKWFSRVGDPITKPPHECGGFEIQKVQLPRLQDPTACLGTEMVHPVPAWTPKRPQYLEWMFLNAYWSMIHP